MVVVPTPPRLPIKATTWPSPSPPPSPPVVALDQRRGKRLAADRLHQVIGGAGGEQIAEQPDIVDRAERDDLEIAAADRRAPR